MRRQGKWKMKCDTGFWGEFACFNMEEPQVLFHANRKKQWFYAEILLNLFEYMFF